MRLHNQRRVMCGSGEVVMSVSRLLDTWSRSIDLAGTGNEVTRAAFRKSLFPGLKRVLLSRGDKAISVSLERRLAFFAKLLELLDWQV